jgi:hypothetical protein
MAYEEQQARKSRVVVETPTSRREVTRTEAVRSPERNGMSGATIGVIVVVAVAVITILVLLLMNNQATDTTNANQVAQQQPAQAPPTTVIQQPAQQPPIIVQQPAPAGQAPVIVNNPPATSAGSSASGNDGAIQAEIDKRITDDPNLATLGVTATVYNGKVTLLGVAKSDSQKTQIERMVRRIRGVKEVDNQITVSAG